MIELAFSEAAFSGLSADLLRGSSERCALILAQEYVRAGQLETVARSLDRVSRTLELCPYGTEPKRS